MTGQPLSEEREQDLRRSNIYVHKDGSRTVRVYGREEIDALLAEIDRLRAEVARLEVAAEHAGRVAVVLQSDKASLEAELAAHPVRLTADEADLVIREWGEGRQDDILALLTPAKEEKGEE